MSLLEQLRGLGLTMGGSWPAQEFHAEDENGEDVTRHSQRWVGWTTDEALAEKAREAGAVVSFYRATDPRFNGWEVTITEVWDG